MFNPWSIETDSLPSKNLDGQIDRPVDTKLRLGNELSFIFLVLRQLEYMLIISFFLLDFANLQMNLLFVAIAFEYNLSIFWTHTQIV